MARTVPFSMGNVYDSPVRLSAIVNVCSGISFWSHLNQYCCNSMAAILTIPISPSKDRMPCSVKPAGELSLTIRLAGGQRLRGALPLPVQTTQPAFHLRTIADERRTV